MEYNGATVTVSKYAWSVLLNIRNLDSIDTSTTGRYVPYKVLSLRYRFLAVVNAVTFLASNAPKWEAPASPNLLHKLQIVQFYYRICLFRTESNPPHPSSHIAYCEL